MRGRLLLPAPGVADVAASTVCGRVRVGGTACGHTLSDGGAHEYTCPVSGLQDARHTRVRKWLAERIREFWACKVDQEVAVTQPLVRRDGRMDVIATRYGVKLLVDVVIGTTFTDNAAERERRALVPGRSLRSAEARKLSRYGPTVLAFAIEDTGRLGCGTVRLLRELAAVSERDASEEYRRLTAELQHVVLSATATMLQVARGQTPTL